MSSAPVFILSCERSGSTLLRYVLDTHPEICSPGELALGELIRTLARTAARTLGRAAGETGDDERTEAARGEVRRVVDDLMGRYAAARGKRIWCDKTPLNVFTLDEIAWAYPEARFLCLYRQSHDVVQSCLDVSRYGFMDGLAQYVQRDPRNVLAALYESWIDKTARILAFEEAGPRAHRVFYEALVHEPRETADGIFDFLEVARDPSLLGRVFTQPHDAGGGDPLIRGTSSIETGRVGRGAPLRDLLPRIPADRRRRLADLHLALGYPV